MNSGHLTAAVTTAQNHAVRLDRETGIKTPESLSVYGSLLLRGAIDVALAFFQWGKYEQAHAALRAAEDTAPQEVAARPSVGTLARNLATLAPVSIRRDAEQFASRDRHLEVTSGHRALTIVACGAGPASVLSTCVELAQDHGWTVQVTATPAVLDFFDAAAIADQILLGPGGFQPHPPRTGGNLIDSYPRHLGIDEAERMLHPAPPMSCAIECEPPASAGVCLLRW